MLKVSGPSADSERCTRAHPSARATFACIRVFHPRVSVHAGDTALCVSVASAIGDTAALLVCLSILIPASSLLTKHSARMCRAPRPSGGLPSAAGAAAT